MLKVPVSVGEALDKISILEIKAERITDTMKLSNVTKELEYLKLATQNYRMLKLEQELKDVNQRLWDVEDNLRLMEEQKDFGSSFIQLARSVYVLNDQRASIKKQINLATNSELIEEKNYAHSV